MKLSMEIFIVLAIVVGIFVYPEYIARQQVAELCESIELNSKMPFDMPTLMNKRKEFKQKFSALYVINFVPDNKEQLDGTGGIVMVFLGGFPFGREYCVLKLNKGVIAEKKTVFNADDYDYCKGDVRLVYECD